LKICFERLFIGQPSMAFMLMNNLFRQSKIHGIVERQLQSPDEVSGIAGRICFVVVIEESEN